MAYCPAQFSPLKSEGRVLIRGVEVRDHRAVIDFTRDALTSSAYLNRAPDEYQPVLAEERAWISAQLAADNALMLAAEQQGRIVGLLETKAGKLRRLRHAITIGLMVAEPWRGKGIGRALMGTLVEWAHANPTVERLEVDVHHRNAPALSLFRSLGFVEEGRRKNAVRYPGGDYADVIFMALMVDRPYPAGR